MDTSVRQKRAKIVVQELKRLFPNAKTALTYSTEWELLVAIILSAQSTDKKVNEVTEKLFQKYTSFEDYLNVDATEFEKDIQQLGLYKSKAKNILGAARIIHELYGGKIPNTLDKLVELPGVGRKTANVFLSVIHGIHEGIAVDTHVRRLAQKFRLTTSNDPKKIERDLMEILPTEEWGMFTIRMIEYGREYSPARKVNDQSDPISMRLKLEIGS